MQLFRSLRHIARQFCRVAMHPGRMTAFQVRLFVILIGILNWNVVICAPDQTLISNIQKRIDYRSCIDRFDVHRDTIIQTEDSRKIGATFLYHTEATNRDECMSVCCEADRCDVFVFEEKYQGSCFLFQCGPPDDFRCQFASHANYSIAVLSIPMSRYKDTKPVAPAAANPPQTPHLSQHELELASLKSGRESFGSYRMPELGSKVLNQPLITTLAPMTTSKTTTTADPIFAAKSVSCGRFQFQCHSGECIAIYNACDGIPQCEDGSDETPACPSQPGTASNKKHSSQMEEPPVYRGQQTSQHRIDEHGINYSDRSRQQYPGKSYEGSEVIGGYNGVSKYGQDLMTGSIEKPPPLRNREDPMSSPRYYPSNNHLEGNNNQQQLARNPSQPLQQSMQTADNVIYNMNDPENRYDPHSNRINSRPLDYYAATGGGGGQANNFRDKYNYYPSNGQQQQPPQQVLQPIGSVVLADGSNSNYPNAGPINYLPVPNANNWASNSIGNNLPPANLNGQSPPQPQQLPASSSNQAAAGGLAPQTNSGIAAGAEMQSNKKPPSKVAEKPKTQSKDEESDEESEQESAEETETTAPAPKKGKSRGKHRKLEKVEEKTGDEGMPTFPPIYQQLKAIGSELDREIIDHDGESDRPTGAVVSLIIGLIVSTMVIMAVYVSCRMRTVGRRIRRTGKGPYAHDADFLVNGMYL